jgi:cytochrome-b5 reductase
VLCYVALLLATTSHQPLKRKPQEISHDTRVFRYALPSADQVLGLPIGKHLMVTATVDGKLVSRAYTPISSDDDVGYFELLIKVYFKNVHPKFPEGGKITQYLESLALGDEIEVLGPKGCITYLGHGRLRVEDKLKRTNPPTFRQCSTIGMIAGGSGITPMLQVRVRACVCVGVGVGVGVSARLPRFLG